MPILQRYSRIYLACLLLFSACSVLAVSPARQENRLLVDGAPATLTFARGCTDPEELPAYRASGFNTLLVTIDSPAPRKLEDAAALIAAAEAQGLFILIELANGSWSSDQYADLANEEFRENCGYFLDAVIPHFREQEKLIGWVIATVDENRAVSDPGTLRDFLEVRYGAFEQLVLAWSEKGTDGEVRRRPRLVNWDHLKSLTQQQILQQFGSNKTVRAKIQEDLKSYNTLLDTRDARFRAFLQQLYPTAGGELLSGALLANWVNGGKGWRLREWSDVTVDAVTLHEDKFPGTSPASLLDLARYRASVSPALFDWWTQEIRRRDADHLLFAGGQHVYRTLITLPRALDGVLTECYPGYAEADIASQNPHAVDIARRGNQFIVLAGVLAWNIRPENLVTAMYAAALHGAAGLCVTDWSALKSSVPADAVVTPIDGVRAALLDLQQRRLLGRTPAPTVALVYSPYIGGLRIGKHALYGYLDRAAFLSGPGTPGSVFFQLREGTSFGQFDFLSGDDLSHVALSRYQTILMPSALDIPTPSQKKLYAFVRDGGTLLADMGAGTIQATSDLYTLPGPLMLLFRVRVVPGVEYVRYNLEMDQPNARFPHVLPGMRTNGLNAGYMVTRMAKVTPLENAQYLFTPVANRSYITTPVVRKPKPLPLQPTRGVFYYRFGKGMAIYAPMPLYQYWLPDSQLFGEFHRDLFGWNAGIFLQRPIDFIPQLAAIAAYADGSVMAWTKDQSRPEVLVKNPDRRLYSVPARDGACLLKPEATQLSYREAGLHLAEPLPVTVGRSPATIAATTRQHDAQALDFTLEADVVDAQHPLVLTITSGALALTAGETYQVLVNGRQKELQVDAGKNLTLMITEKRTRIRLGDAETAHEGSDVIIDVNPLENAEPIITVTPTEE